MRNFQKKKIEKKLLYVCVCVCVGVSMYGFVCMGLYGCVCMWVLKWP